MDDRIVTFFQGSGYYSTKVFAVIRELAENEASLTVSPLSLHKRPFPFLPLAASIPAHENLGIAQTSLCALRAEMVSPPWISVGQSLGSIALIFES